LQQYFVRSRAQFLQMVPLQPAHIVQLQSEDSRCATAVVVSITPVNSLPQLGQVVCWSIKFLL
jgi:hypothetical protein